jgi:hypothetical protein
MLRIPFSRLLPYLLPAAVGALVALLAIVVGGAGPWGIGFRLAALLLTSLGIGLWALEPGPDLSPIETIACAAGLGYGLLALAFLALGGMGLLSPGPLLFLIALGCVAAGPPLWQWVRVLAGGRGPGPVPLSAMIAALVLAGALLLTALAALRPPATPEAFTSTAAIPEQWALAGRATPAPDLYTSWAPPGAAIHRAAALLLGGERLAGPWGAAAALLLPLGAALLSRWLTGGGWAAALLAAALLAAVPALPLAAAAPAGLPPAAGLVLLSIWGFLRGVEEGGWRWPALAGLLLGFGLAASYGAWVAVPTLLVLALVYRPEAEPYGPALGRAALVSGIALVPALPLFLRNWIGAGNPVYPHLWGGRLWDEASAAALTERVLDVPGALVVWLGAPGETNVLGPALVVVLLVAVVAPLLGDRALGLAIAGGTLGILWAVSGAELAWTLPALGCAAALCSAAAARVRRRKPAAGKALLLLLLLAAGAGVASLAHCLDVRRRGLLPDREELAAGYPREGDYAVLRSLLPERARVLLIGETRAYRLGREAVWGTEIDAAPIARLVREAREEDPERPELAFRRLLRREGITHVLQAEGRSRRLDREHDHFRELRGGRWGIFLRWLERPSLVWSNADGDFLFDARGVEIEEDAGEAGGDEAEPAPAD